MINEVSNMYKVRQRMELTQREELIVASLIAGQTKAQTARDLGIAESTVYHTINRRHVKVKLSFLKDETREKRDAAIQKYNDTVFQALEILSDIMFTGDKEADRIKAAKIFLDKAPMMQEVLEIKVTHSPIIDFARELANINLDNNKKAYSTMADLEEAIDNGKIIPEGEEHEEVSDTE